jgi:hypothetical protein
LKPSVFWPVEAGVVGDDVVADLDALVADEHRRSGNQLPDVVLVLVTERAAEDFVFAGLFDQIRAVVSDQQSTRSSSSGGDRPLATVLTPVSGSHHQ